MPLEDSDDQTVPPSGTNRDSETRTPDESGISSVDPIRSIGPYQLVEVLGEGGMGTVWLAQQEKPVRRQVALKLIKGAHASSEIITRFEAERQALAMMEHPNIAKVFDAGTSEDGCPFFVMELVQGAPINQFCDDHKLSPDQRLELFVSVCTAVQHAHQKGVIHRDLKPSNVLVSSLDANPTVKVIDFGLAKAIRHEARLTEETLQTEFGQVLGTLRYMSPEQASLDLGGVDTRSDIYSLGAILYELLAGSTPVQKETLRKHALLQVLEIIAEDEPPRPSHRLSSSANSIEEIGSNRQIHPAKLQHILRGELDWIVMKALEKESSRRYATATDFADDIKRYLGGEVVQARPPSKAYQFKKFIARNRGLVASLVGLFALLFAGIVGTASGWNTALIETANAKKETLRADSERENAVESKNEAEKTSARSNFFLATARFEQDRVREAHELLDNIPQEYRNIEWYHANRKLLGADVTCYGHSSPVKTVVYSPDGTTVASGSDDGTIKLWNAYNGEELKTLKHSGRRISSVAFSPDGKLIASTTRYGADVVTIWGVESGDVLKTFAGHEDDVNCVVFSPDGKTVVTASDDKSVRVWDVETGKEQFVLKDHTNKVQTVAYSPDGSKFASGGDDRQVRIWDAETGKLLQAWRPGGVTIRSLCFSPDGWRILIDNSARIHIWAIESEQVVYTMSGHKAWVNQAVFSPDGMWMATASKDKTVKIWDTWTGNELFHFSGHKDQVQSIAFSPDGKRIVTASDDNTVKFWDVRTGTEMVRLYGHSEFVLFKSGGHANLFVLDVDFDSTGNRIVSAGTDKAVIVWDATTGRRKLKMHGHTASVFSVDFSPDGSKVVSAGGDKRIVIWDANSGAQLRRIETESKLRVAVFSPDGKTIASAGKDSIIRIWDAETGTLLRELTGHTKEVICLVYSPDGTRIATAGGDEKVIIWDSESGKELETFSGHTGYVYGLDFNKDGNRLASCSFDQTVKIWGVENNGELIRSIPCAARTHSVRFNPEGNRVCTAEDYSATLWDVATGEELEKLANESTWIRGATFSPNGSRIAIAGPGAVVSLVEAVKKSETVVLRGHQSDVTSISFSSDGSRIVSGSRKGQLIIWDTKSFKAVRDVNPEGNYINSAVFDEEDSCVFVSSSDGKFIWEPEKNERHDSVKWVEHIARKLSPCGRWMLTCSGNEVIVVDLHFKVLPEEKNYREIKSRSDALWHARTASYADYNRDWYGAAFHYAWNYKLNNFEGSRQELIESLRQAKILYGGMDFVLPKIVRDVLDVEFVSEVED